MKRITRRLLALIGAAFLLVLALVAGPAVAATGAMITPFGRGSGLVRVSGSPPISTGGLIALLSVLGVAVVAGVALTLGLRNRRSAAIEGPAEDAGRTCNEVVCEWHPPRLAVQERKAA